MKLAKTIIASAIPLALMLGGHAQAADEIKIGVVTFLSGPAASPFGVPARNAAELLIEQFNKGQAPAL